MTTHRHTTTGCEECGSFPARDTTPLGQDSILCKDCSADTLVYFLANAHDIETDPSVGELVHQFTTFWAEVAR